jgi:hypothetical protein
LTRPARLHNYPSTPHNSLDVVVSSLSQGIYTICFPLHNPLYLLPVSPCTPHSGDVVVDVLGSDNPGLLELLALAFELVDLDRLELTG